MDFEYSAKTQVLQKQVSAFMDEHVYPGEAAYRDEMLANPALESYIGGLWREFRGWLADGALKLEVTALPEAGRANQAVCDLIAEAVRVGKRQVTVARGETSRSKQIEVEGIETAELNRRIQRALEEAEHRGE